jgi:hypothetical protein
MATQLGILEIYKKDDVSFDGHFISLHEKDVFNPSLNFGAGVVLEIWDKFGRNTDHPQAQLLNKAAEAKQPELLEDLIQKVTFEAPNEDDTNFTITVKDTSLLEFIEAGVKWDSYLLG